MRIVKTERHKTPGKIGDSIMVTVEFRVCGAMGDIDPCGYMTPEAETQLLELMRSAIKTVRT